MTRKEITSLILLALVIIIAIYKFATVEYEFVDSKYLNYTPTTQGNSLRTEIYVLSDKKNGEEITKQAFAYMQDLIYKFSEDYEESIVYKINHSKGEKVSIDQDIYELLLEADKMYKLTDGQFDITIKPLYDLWDFEKAERGNSEYNASLIPDSTEIKEKLQLVDFSKVQYDKDYIKLPADMQITFGALSKGYIVDKTVEMILSQGVKAGYVDQISSIRYFGDISQKIILGIQHPRNSSEIIAQLTNLNKMSVATSGDYQQYFDVGNIRYHHLINAVSGYPCHQNASVTILAPTAFEADALSTALFMLDSDRAIDYLKTLNDTEAIIYSDIYDEVGKTWEATSLKTEKTDNSKGIDYYLYNEFIDGE